MMGTMSGFRAGAGRQTGLVRGGLHRFVTERLGTAIGAGELVAGQQIVPEELGARLEVSRTVVREALRTLTDKGMVTASPRLGTRVTPVERWSLLDPDVIMWRVLGPQRDEQLRELMALREGVEPLAAAGSADHASEDDTAVLVACCDTMEAAAARDDLASFTEADIRFHSTVLTSSGNLIFRQFAAPIEAVLMARKSLDMLPPRLESNVLRHHRLIASAIAGHDADTAEALTRTLITVAREEIFAEVDRQAAGRTDQ